MRVLLSQPTLQNFGERITVVFRAAERVDDPLETQMKRHGRDIDRPGLADIFGRRYDGI